MSPAPKPLRVGSVPYLVARPLDTGLEAEPGIELSRHVPARLVEGLRAGELDVALVSSIELFRRPGYGYLAGPSVAGRGRVSSVQLFLRRPIEQVRTIALDPASRTSSTLLRVVLEGEREYLEVPLGEDPRAAGTDAWLRIGDEALRERLGPDAPPVFDPAEAWLGLTGLPFVFALWIAAPGVDLAPWARAFEGARERGLELRGELAERAAREWDLPLEATRHYLFEQIHYDLGAELAPALEAFGQRAAARGLCESGLEPRSWELSGT